MWPVSMLSMSINLLFSDPLPLRIDSLAFPQRILVSLLDDLRKSYSPH